MQSVKELFNELRLKRLEENAYAANAASIGKSPKQLAFERGGDKNSSVEVNSGQRSVKFEKGDEFLPDPTDVKEPAGPSYYKNSHPDAQKIIQTRLKSRIASGEKLLPNMHDNDSPEKEHFSKLPNEIKDLVLKSHGKG